jgi:hypothetical protein
MQEKRKPGPSTGLVLLAGVTFPYVIALASIVAFGAATRLASLIARQPAPDTAQGMLSGLFVFAFLHALAQSAFVLFGALRIAPPKMRALFLAVTLPNSAFVSLGLFMALIAR